MQKLNKKDDKQSGSERVLVIGGGVGGIRAALDLAESRRDVLLIDKSYSIGGLMTQLDRTFPTNNCDLCTVSPFLSASGRERYLDIKPMTRIEELTGQAGNFTATLVTEPRYIDIDKCTGCGECVQKFPEAVRFTPGLDPRAPTCMRYPQATPYAFSIDMAKVEDISQIQKVCKADAILSHDEVQKTRIKVGSVVLSVGAELFDPSVLDNYGGGQCQNIVTGLEYERIMSASGPFQGSLVRVSDNKQPKKIAWIQCVGSRGINEADVPYCSGVCCMYALKEAMVTKERFEEDIETTIFYMDMRTHGKDYERYFNRAKDEYKVRMIRSRPHSIIENSSTKDLSITYALEEEAVQKTEDFDMVVLSTGFRAGKDATDLASKLGIDLNEHNFAKTDHFNSVKTSRPGVYVCGVYESPKDIPETMVQASAAALMASANLPVICADEKIEDFFPRERDVTGQEVKLGVFVCDCGIDIGGVVDVGKLIDYVKTNSDVAVAKAVGHGCSAESMAQIESLILEHGVNRVVIGGCSPRTHESKFQDLLRRVGLNRYLVEIVNLRDQNTWAHRGQPRQAQEKACKLLQIGISGVRKNRPLMENTLPMSQNALVIGGGVTGMTSALKLADQGILTYIIERAPALGGLARSIRKTIEGEDVGAFVARLVEKVMAHENIHVMTRSIVVDHSGMPGLFKTGIQTGLRMNYMSIDHGVTILATGALANRPGEYGLGTLDGVVTQLELDFMLEDDTEKIAAMDQVVMIQCVGSREENNPNCSRICCQAAMKNALRIKQINPETQVFVLYRDIRTYGFQEDYYREARNLGVKFVRYSLNTKPLVTQEDGRFYVRVYDFILGQKIEIEADCLALSTGLVADDETTEDLAMMFHLPRTLDHYFLEEHVKLRPVDMAVRGVFIAGTIHSPKTIRESVTQALAAAGRAQTLLAKKEINLGAAVVRVDKDKCASCLVCVRACPFDIPFINADGYSQIDPDKCQGCGVCAADCPAKAIQLLTYEDDQILAKLDGLFERVN
ncbi:MAG: CoB--CoM heterodisulfide reductase iron-sulfur subunit A family protein [Desulfobacteraceae bacterium]|nr:CoB--CoM heterodisulfide reductase iron-sulfur subunit A family protein [Desulfobacteraceae bacterium]